MDLGIYVLCKNEERFIKDCLKELIKVYPDKTTVIDLGSVDKTLDLIPSSVKVEETPCTAEDYPDLKNDLMDRHEWTFLVDGDEIYTRGQLYNIPDLIKSNAHTAYRTAWRYVMENEDKWYIAERNLVNGPKLYCGKYLRFKNPWPFEVTNHRKGHNPEPKNQASLWCFHAKLMERSSVTDVEREKKRQWYMNKGLRKYHGEVKFYHTTRLLPWS